MINCTISVDMDNYIEELDYGTDLQQSHNFITINQESGMDNFLMKFIKQSNYTMLYQWMEPSKFGLDKSFFASNLKNVREFQNTSKTTVIINASTAKLKIEFVKNNLLDEITINSTQQLSNSLLILGSRPERMDFFSTNLIPAQSTIRVLNLTDSLGLCYFKLTLFLFMTIFEKPFKFYSIKSFRQTVN